MKLNKIHHVAVICSDYEKSKHFYTDVLGMKIVSENYREGRDSWKADCWLDDSYVIELFSFPNPPARPSYPEAAGLRILLLRWMIFRIQLMNLTVKASLMNPSVQMNILASDLYSSVTQMVCR